MNPFHKRSSSLNKTQHQVQFQDERSSSLIGSDTPIKARAVPKLHSNQDWGFWLENVRDQARRMDIWQYVDPTNHEILVQPEKPKLPVVILPEVPLRKPAPLVVVNEEPVGEKGDLDKEYVKRVQHHKIQCDRIERQHRLNIMTYQCREKRYQEEMKQYRRQQYFIRSLRLCIEDSARDKYAAVLMRYDDPREQLQVLVERGQEPVKNRFLELMRRRDVKDWEQWICQVERAWIHCKMFGVSTISDYTASREFVAAVKNSHAWFYAFYSRAMEMDRIKAKESDFLVLTDRFRFCLEKDTD